MIYVAAGSSVNAYDYATGAVVWTSAAVTAVGAIILDGTKLIVPVANGLVVLDTATGNSLFSPSVIGNSIAGVTVNGANYYVATTAGFVYAFDSNFTQIWTVPVLEAVQSNVVLHDNGVSLDVIVATMGGNVLRFDAGAGTESPSNASFGSAIDAITVGGDVLYFSAQSLVNNFVALNLMTMNQIWAVLLDSWGTTTPTVLDGVVYTTSTLGLVHALSVVDGASLWTFDAHSLGGANADTVLVGKIAIVEGVLSMTTNNGYFFGLNVKNAGSLLWVGEVLESVTAPPIFETAPVMDPSSGNIIMIAAHVVFVATPTYPYNIVPFGRHFSAQGVNEFHADISVDELQAEGKAILLQNQKTVTVGVVAFVAATAVALLVIRVVAQFLGLASQTPLTSRHMVLSVVCDEQNPLIRFVILCTSMFAIAAVCVTASSHSSHLTTAFGFATAVSVVALFAVALIRSVTKLFSMHRSMSVSAVEYGAPGVRAIRVDAKRHRAIAFFACAIISASSLAMLYELALEVQVSLFVKLAVTTIPCIIVADAILAVTAVALRGDEAIPVPGFEKTGLCYSDILPIDGEIRCIDAFQFHN